MTDVAGRYRLLHALGEGGMGVVHAAEDLRLGRRVAIKMIRNPDDDVAARARFEREARAAAALSHPNACQVHEIGESDGQPFIVMELLSGETLSARLARGPLPAGEAIDTMLPVLRALGALHAAGLIHRDVKPANIFLTEHGVKLLDFGLARPASPSTDVTTTGVTGLGAVVGTPRYMAPEQVGGDEADARADLFAAGAVIYELLSGRPPFPGDSAAATMQAILRDPPAPFDAPPALRAVVLRALQKRVGDRYPNAEAMAAELSAARGAAIQAPPPGIRLVVLPFRMLRDDQDIAFLAGALPEAITTSLSNVRSILVRSNLAAARLGPQADPAQAGVELDVNHVLTGTILRAGARLRVTCQLIEVPGGRVAWSGVKELPVGDLFELQDHISRHIVESLPLDGARVDTADVDAPASPRAYELYLRASQLTHHNAQWQNARALFEQCTEEDPNFAPAWAHLGRLYRLIGKYLDRDVETHYRQAGQAFERAFRLNPSLSLTHHQFAYLEVERGHSDRALIRLTTQIRERPNQPELYAALCHVARYCGLLDVSLTADARARRLDAHVKSSVVNTHLLVADHTSMLAAARGVADVMVAIALYEVGELQGALEVCRTDVARFPAGTVARTFYSALYAIFADDREAIRPAALQMFDVGRSFLDGEFHFYQARVLTRAGLPDEALVSLDRAIEQGFFPAEAIRRDLWLAPLRDGAGFTAICDRAAARSRSAAETFDAVGGYGLLGLKRDPAEPI